MYLAGLGTAVPPRRYTQRECWEAAQGSGQYARLTPRSRAILRKVLTGSNGIATRHLALESLDQAFDLTPDALHRRFATEAPDLAAQAARRALDAAGMKGTEIDGLLISTCTGYLCPGLTSYVAERLGLEPSILMLDLVGQGCGAALPNLRAARALLDSDRHGAILSVCVEVCSAALYLDNDPGVLISACLFGDGAGAAVLTAERRPGREVRWLAEASLLNPAARDLLRFEHRDGMLRNLLSPAVPGVAGEAARTVCDGLLGRMGLSRPDIRTWVMHPGGRDVLLALQEALALNDGDLHWSARVLERYGNLSSPSVFFVLESALNGGAPPGHWWMSSFGAGFSCFGALLSVQ